MSCSTGSRRVVTTQLMSMMITVLSLGCAKQVLFCYCHHCNLSPPPKAKRLRSKAITADTALYTTFKSSGYHRKDANCDKASLLPTLATIRNLKF